MAEPKNDVKVQWGPCCFCAQPIADSPLDPCRVTVENAAGKWQVWFCHAECFKARLTDPPEAPGMTWPAHL